MLGIVHCRLLKPAPDLRLRVDEGNLSKVDTLVPNISSIEQNGSYPSVLLVSVPVTYRTPETTIL